MKDKRSIFHRAVAASALFLALLFCWLITGCASKNVNPSSARSHTGYVDFIADDDTLCWQVDRIDGGKTNELFAQFNPLEDRILRLAFKPGHYTFRITFLNHVITEAGVIEVEIKDGMVTPVGVSLVETGEVLVENKQLWIGGNYYGRYGRGIKTRSNEAIMYRVNASTQDARPYKPKDDMPYAVDPAP